MPAAPHPPIRSVAPEAPGAFTALERALGRDRLFTDPATLDLYALDDTPRRCPPLGVAFPRDHDQLAAVVAIAHEHRLPLVPRAGGSGNVGGALPVPGSLVVSCECLQRVLEFDPANRLIVAESGVVTAEIERLARRAGLFFPPDPGSAAFCRLGGNLAMNAAGPRSVKYGSTRDYVLGLKAVAGDGRTLVTGCRTTKGVVGYDLTRLLVGSEGTLALISEATLRLLPAPATVGSLRACFESASLACAAVGRVMAQRVMPSAVEYMDAAALAAVRAAGAATDLPGRTAALLMVEADGEPEAVERELAALSRALEGPGLLEVRRATDAGEIAGLWRARKALSTAVKAMAPLKINEDVVVPVSRLAELVGEIEALAARHRLSVVSFGHAGNGNLHVNILVHPEDEAEMARAADCRRALFEAVLRLQGTLSGEHGIGTEKRQFVPWEIPPDTLALQRAIKAQFDPRGILNPGKLFPDDARP